MSATKTSTAKPVTLNTKVGDALKEHPELLEVLVAQSPHFSRLKNPILRRIHGRFVTLGQAAAIAGLDPATLIRNLNAAIGVTSVEKTPFKLNSMAGTPEPPWVAKAQVVASIDVREDQRQHADPFKRIMSAVGEVKDGQVFLLRNTFEPLPLYDVLGKRGFVAWSRKLGPDDWEVFFLKTGQGDADNEAATPAPAASASADIVAGTPTAAIEIDVSELTPPQPMMKILDALATLKAGDTLLVRHKRRPAYLYPKLAELGYKQKTIEHGPDNVEIYIQKV